MCAEASGPWRAGPGPTPACSRMSPWPRTNANQCGPPKNRLVTSWGVLGHSLRTPTPALGLTRSGTPCTGLGAPRLALRTLTGLLDTGTGWTLSPFSPARKILSSRLQTVELAQIPRVTALSPECAITLLGPRASVRPPCLRTGAIPESHPDSPSPSQGPGHRHRGPVE